MADLERRTEGRDTVLTLRGDLTIARAREIRTGILEALAGASSVRIELQSIADIDVAVLQLFCAFHRSAARHNIGFRFDGGGERRFTEVLFRAGFPRHVGCQDMDRRSCFWICDQGKSGVQDAAGART